MEVKMFKKVAAALTLGAALLSGISACSYTQPVYGNPGNIQEATKEGRATCGTVLGIFRFGDCSVGTIAKNAGINEVIVVDEVNSNYVGLYIGQEVIVRGK
jgi:hypothetical protein